MNERLRFYVDAIRAGLTPNAPAALRPNLFAALSAAELDAYLARLRKESSGYTT